jgi:hypothetical protein
MTDETAILDEIGDPRARAALAAVLAVAATCDRQAAAHRARIVQHSLEGEKAGYAELAAHLHETHAQAIRYAIEAALRPGT